MGRQNKRTMKKYNHSRRKNNTRRKTHKKRVRKTHKKRTHKRMKGGSLHEPLYGNQPVQPGSGINKFTQPLKSGFGQLRNMGQSLISAPQKVIGAIGNKTDNPEYYIQAPTGDAPSPVLPQATQATQAAPAQGSKFSSITNNPNYSGAKEFAKLGTAAAIGANPLLAAGVLGGVAAGAAGTYATYKAGQAANELRKSIGRGIGSAKDKLKSKALMKNIEQCLKILVNYAVIGDGARKTILEKFIQNSGYFDEQGNAPKITFKKELRKKQIEAKDAAEDANKDKKIKGQYALNVGETPGTAVNTVPQQQSGPPPLIY